jgi:hypothetical protein
MGDAEAEGSRDMVRFPEGKDRPRTMAREGAVVNPKAGAAVCARTEVEISMRTDRTAVGMLTEEDAARNREAAKIRTTDAQGMGGSRRNVEGE